MSKQLVILVYEIAGLKMQLCPLRFKTRAVSSFHKKGLLTNLDYGALGEVFCPFRTFSDLTIGHLMNFAGGARCYNISKSCHRRCEYAVVNTQPSFLSNSPKSCFIYDRKMPVCFYLTVVFISWSHVILHAGNVWVSIHKV